MSTITLDVRGVGRVDVKLNGSANPGTLERNGGSLMIAAALRERSALDHQINGNQDASTKQLVAAARDYIRLAKRLEKEGLSEQASIQRGNASEIYSQLGNSAVATVQKKLAMKNMADHGLTLGAKAYAESEKGEYHAAADLCKNAGDAMLNAGRSDEAEKLFLSSIDYEIKANGGKSNARIAELAREFGMQMISADSKIGTFSLMFKAQEIYKSLSEGESSIVTSNAYGLRAIAIADKIGLEVPKEFLERLAVNLGAEGALYYAQDRSAEGSITYGKAIELARRAGRDDIASRFLPRYGDLTKAYKDMVRGMEDKKKEMLEAA